MYGGRPLVHVKESNSRRPSRDYQPKKRIITTSVKTNAKTFFFVK